MYWLYPDHGIDLTCSDGMREPIPDTGGWGAMFTVAQCLDKAMELEQRAAEGHAPQICSDINDMALQGRRLAGRAMVQDQRAATIRGVSPDGG